MNRENPMSTHARVSGVVIAAAIVALAAPVVLAGADGPATLSSIHQWQQALPPGFEAPAGAGTDEEQNSDFRSETTDRQTYTMPIGASGSLELSNVSGDITVVAGTGREATVEAVRRSRGRDDAAARLGLSDVRVEVDHQGERATVKAVYPQRNRPPYSVSVAYTVTAPAGTRLTASSVSGDVTVRGITGDVVAASVSGDVTVSNGSRVTAKSVSGDVVTTALSGGAAVAVASVSGDLKLDDIRAQRLDAESVSGSVIVTRASSAGANLKGVSGDIRFQGNIERGGRYEFQSHSGDIHVTSAGPAGFELQASTFNGSLRAEPPALVKSSTLSRGSLRGTIGDGSAVVVATTFSGDVTIVAPQ